MQRMTRIPLVLIVLVPVLWVWPQRGVTTAFYSNRDWRDQPAIVRVERQISLDFLTADSASLPQHEFSVEWNGWLRIDREGQYTFSTRSDSAVRCAGTGSAYSPATSSRRYDGSVTGVDGYTV